jgi:hypothetical protein
MMRFKRPQLCLRVPADDGAITAARADHRPQVLGVFLVKLLCS